MVVHPQGDTKNKPLLNRKVLNMSHVSVATCLRCREIFTAKSDGVGVMEIGHHLLQCLGNSVVAPSL